MSIAEIPAVGPNPPVAPAPSAETDPRALLTQALALGQAGQCGVAAQLFEQAAQAFAAAAAVDPADRGSACFAEYCRAMADGMLGIDLARSGDRPKSLEYLTSATNRMAQTVLPLADQADPTWRGLMLVDLNYLKASRYVTEMMQDIVGEDFDSARRTAKRIFADLDDVRAQIDAMGDQPELGPLRGTLEAVSLAIRGLDLFAAAEEASANRQWEAALDGYADAKQSLRDTRDAYAALPNLASQAQVWTMLLETMVEPARKRCKRMQGLWEDSERFRQGMTALARAIGAPEVTTTTVVSNTAQATAELTSRIEIQMTLINSFETRTRSALDDLRAAIAAAPADPAARAEALDAIDKVIAPPAHDGGFFDRFKRFCSDSAEVVGNVAKVAGPVALAWNVFAPFFGLPVLPLPA